ncbi:MAG: RHS repeat-associated core domain-containing protein, partial [bacterium]
SSTTYYPFGMPLKSRALQTYRFGFKGMESDPEWTGNNVITYDYGFRIYDTRIARFLSVDPLTSNYPHYTPYQFAGNKPIWCIDIDGLEELIVTEYYKKNQWYQKVTYNGDDAGSGTVQYNQQGNKPSDIMPANIEEQAKINFFRNDIENDQTPERPITRITTQAKKINTPTDVAKRVQEDKPQIKVDNSVKTQNRTIENASPKKESPVNNSENNTIVVETGATFKGNTASFQNGQEQLKSTFDAISSENGTNINMTIGVSIEKDATVGGSDPFNYFNGKSAEYLMEGRVQRAKDMLRESGVYLNNVNINRQYNTNTDISIEYEKSKDQ